MKNNKDKKINIAILFGGKSAEHEVSVRSAQNIARALDINKYNITLVGIDKSGIWIPFNLSQLLLAEKVALNEREKDNLTMVPYTNRGEFLVNEESGNQKIDVVFPVLHGPMGEDGTIQGLLKLASIPFVGAGVIGSAVGMDKDVMKRLLRDAKLPVAKFIVYKESNKKISFEKIKQILGLPFFVKPANLGSSVGITKVHNKKEFKTSLISAFSYDSKIIIEEYIQGREIECSVLGNDKPVASVCGEIIPKHEFYSYEAKYLDENGALLSIPAKIDKGLQKKIQKLAIEAFKVLECEGMARIDFFIDKKRKIFINEINTIPGFTSISMYPKLWQQSGISYQELIDTLVKLAMERFHREQKIQTYFLK